MKRIIQVLIINLLLMSFVYADDSSWTNDQELVADYKIVLINLNRKLSPKIGEELISNSIKLVSSFARDTEKIALYFEKLANSTTDKYLRQGYQKMANKYNTLKNTALSYKFKIRKARLLKDKKKLFKFIYSKIPFIGIAFDTALYKQEINKEKEKIEKEYPNVKFNNFKFFKEPLKWLSENGGNMLHNLINSILWGSLPFTNTTYDLDDLMPDNDGSRRKWLKYMSHQLKLMGGIIKFKSKVNLNAHYIPKGFFQYLTILKDLNRMYIKEYNVHISSNLDWLQYYKLIKNQYGTYTVKYDRYKANTDKEYQLLVASHTEFIDAQKYDWAEKYIKRARAQKIEISGLNPAFFGVNEKISNVEALKWIVSAYGIRQILPDDAPLGSQGADAFDTPLNNFYKETEIDWTNAYYKYFIETKYIPASGITKNNLLEPAIRKTVAQLLFNVFKLPIREHFGSHGEEGKNKKLENIRKNDTDNSWFYEAAVLRKLKVAFGQCPTTLETCKPSQRQFEGSRNISRIEVLAMIVRLNSYKYCNNNTCTFDEYFKGN